MRYSETANECSRNPRLSPELISVRGSHPEVLTSFPIIISDRLARLGVDEGAPINNVLPFYRILSTIWLKKSSIFYTRRGTQVQVLSKNICQVEDTPQHQTNKRATGKRRPHKRYVKNGVSNGASPSFYPTGSKRQFMVCFLRKLCTMTEHGIKTAWDTLPSLSDLSCYKPSTDVRAPPILM